MDDAAAFQAMGEALVARGLMTPEAVAADLAPKGEAEPAAPALQAATTPTTPTTPGPVDPLDAMAFAPAVSPAEFNFGTAPQGVETSLEQETHFRELFVQHEIPKPIGDQIGRLWNQAIASPPTEAQLDRMYQDGHAALFRMWGADLDRNLAVANAEIDRMAKANPEIKHMLRFSGLGNNAWLASTLFHLARARGRG